jgi:uncharacterized iron-regulated membrane protein
MTIKKIIGKIHLWLGLSSGLVVLFLGITGCILAFQQEIESATQSYRYVPAKQQPILMPSVLKPIAEAQVPGKHPHSVLYEQGKAAQVMFYGEDYYDVVYLDPYSGEVLKNKNMNRDFFRQVIIGHYQLWLPVQIGQPIVATATLIFLILMITGIVLWWPKNKAARKQRFSIKWNVRWRRKNYDLHTVLGFYMSWIAIFIAITGLVMGFQWFAGTVYYVSSGGDRMQLYYEPVSQKKPISDSSFQAVDSLYRMAAATYKQGETIEVHFPETDTSVVALAINPKPGTYWKVDYTYYDQYSLQEIPVTHPYGQYAKASIADKISRMNYDIHVGAIGGLPTKLLAFFASLIAASLPVTGFLIWWGRRKK